MKIASLVLLAAMIGGCQAGAMSSSSSAGHGTMMTRTELTFGAGRSDAANVSDWAWQSFVDHEITPRFPDGFTVVPVNGQWKNKAGTIVHERSWMVIIVHASSPDADRKINEVRDAYKKQFNQESVMRSDFGESVSF